MGIIKKIVARNDCPQDYAIICTDYASGKTGYSIEFNGKDTGWSGSNVKAAIKAAKKMAKDN